MLSINNNNLDFTNHVVSNNQGSKNLKSNIFERGFNDVSTHHTYDT
jgi:hypothetical protein